MVFIKKILSIFNKGIVMYSDSMWTDCQEAKRFFAENGVNVTIKDIANEDNRQEMKKKFNRVMVPVIITKEKIFIGFEDNKVEINKVMGK